MNRRELLSSLIVSSCVLSVTGLKLSLLPFIEKIKPLVIRNKNINCNGTFYLGKNTHLIDCILNFPKEFEGVLLNAGDGCVVIGCQFNIEKE